MLVYFVSFSLLMKWSIMWTHDGNDEILSPSMRNTIQCIGIGSVTLSEN